MRLHTVVALGVVFLTAAAVAVVGPGETPTARETVDAAGGEDRVRAVQANGDAFHTHWTYTPPEELESNHHTPAATFVRGEAFVVVPINSRHGTLCRVTTLDGGGHERWNDTIPRESCTVHAASDPTIADYDTDGHQEALVATSEKALVAYNLTTGRAEFRQELTSYGYAKPLVANLTAHPGPETIAVDLLGGVFVLDASGERVWTRELGDARVRQPAVRDFDADGTPELAVGQLDAGVVLLDHDGSTVWRKSLDESVSIRWMTTGELDDDSAVEVVVATFTGHVLALDGRTGAIEWETDLGKAAGGGGLSERRQLAVALHGVRGAAVNAVGDGDGDGQTEVYPVARNGQLYSLDGANGTVEWATSLTNETVTVSPPPSMGDIDDDSAEEIVAVTETGQIRVVDPETGEIEASYAREPPIRTFPRLADIDGDATPEILAIYGDGSVVALSYSGTGNVTG